MPTRGVTFHVGPTTSLRPASVEDAAVLFALVDANRAYLRVWLPWLDHNRTEDDTRSFLHAVAERGRAGRGSVWVVEEAGVVCGLAGFNWVEPTNRVCEVGYWLAAAYQGRGIMTACVSRLVRHAFEELNLNRVTLPVAVGNGRSRRVPERLDFRAEGVLRQAEWLYDHFVDHVLYAQVRSDRAGE